MLSRIRGTNAPQSHVPIPPGMVPGPHYPIIRGRDVDQRSRCRARAARAGLGKQVEDMGAGQLHLSECCPWLMLWSLAS